jgi:AraC-like DNA-binding protein
LKSVEQNIEKRSDYYIYEPTQEGKKMYFYPICIGHFFYEPGYHLERKSYDSYLFMYIVKGSLTVRFRGQEKRVFAGSFVFLNCYEPHAYYSNHAWESIWVHFDGPVAAFYAEKILRERGFVFEEKEPVYLISKLMELYRMFEKVEPIRECWLSKLLTDFLTAIFENPQEPDGKEARGRSRGGEIEQTVDFMRKHFTEKLSVDQLADRAAMSPYYFIRTFKKETGYTPHEYLLTLRMNMAVYLLHTTKLSVTQIGRMTGFSNDALFCSEFRKRQGLTPSEERRRG